MANSPIARVADGHARPGPAGDPFPDRGATQLDRPATQPASAQSLEDFIGNPGYGTPELRRDLDRFVFLLGGNDGETLFGP